MTVKKFVLAIAMLPILLSCALYTTPPLGETDFPLKKAKTIPIDENIESIAVGNTWIAIQTQNSIIGLDINTFETLWKIDAQVNKFEEGFEIVNDRLITTSGEQIVIVDRQGNKETKDLDKDVKTVVRFLGVYPDYVYVAGGDYWSLEAYDLTHDKMLWKSRVGRDVGDVFYDLSKNIAYLTKDDSIVAYENSSGRMLWEKENVYGRGALYSSGILYVPVSTKTENALRLEAIEGVTQKTLWEKDILRPADIKASSSTVFDNLLIYRGYGILAVDRTTGELLWTVPSIGEEFIGNPIEFDGVIYIKEYSGTVFAISPKDGTIIGHVKLEDRGSFDKVYGSIHNLSDGIIFSTKNELVIYKLK